MSLRPSSLGLPDQTISSTMSAAGPGLVSRSATRVVAQAANGFHLLRIDGYSQAKTLLPGQKISSQGFAVGGHAWRMDYYPNGRDASANSNAISLYLQRIDNHDKQILQARYKFSLLDHDGNAAYELPAETGSFASAGVYPNPYASMTGTYGGGEEPGPGCGHEEFIGREELDRREHLIRDDSIVVRCDVGVTQIHIDGSWLAMEDHNAWEDGVELEEEGYEAPGYGALQQPGYYGAPRRRRRKRMDDSEYVKWCVAQRPAGAPR